ncbi:MAG: hypothetical protein AAFO94_06615 [Bacteroidota bacterium]
MKKSFLQMEKIVVNRLMRILNSFSVELRLEILSRLSEKLKLDFNPKPDKKEKLLHELYGSWKDMDENLEEDIIKSRSTTDKNISLD